MSKTLNTFKIITRLGAAMVTLLGLGSGSAFAGSIFLTGHDVDLHDGQEGYDNIIVDWLRGAGTTSEIAASNYSIAVVGSGVGSWGWTDVPDSDDKGAKPGFESTTFFDTDELIAGTKSFSDVLSKDLLVVLSHASCGGCDLNTAGSNYINSQAASIATAFNSGMDIWGLTGAELSTYYNFLPPGAIASGSPISGSTGFTPTDAGTGIGITSEMVNGHQTHNRFTSYDPDFQVFETRDDGVISIGIRDASISGGGIVTTPSPPTEIPFEFSPSLGLLMLGGWGAIGKLNSIVQKRKSFKSSFPMN